MFKPMSHREELPSNSESRTSVLEPAEKPKQSNSIPNLESMSLEEMKAIWAQISVENPTLAPTERNGGLVVQFLKQNNIDFTLENCRIAVRVLGYPSDQLDRQKPPAPPPPPVVEEPAEPAEILEPGQLSIHATEWELRQSSVTPAQLKDYLRRVREAEAAKK